MPPEPAPSGPLSLEGHRVLELPLGILLIVLPVVLNFPIAGFVLSMGAGALIVAVAIAATREGRTLTGSSHRYVDLLLLAFLVVGALVAAAWVIPIGTAIELATAAIVYAALIAATRYVERGERRPGFTAGRRIDRTT